MASFNIVSAVARHLTPEVIGKIGIAAGLYGSGAQAAVNAAVPAILSALADLVDKTGGPRKLANAAAAQPTEVLTNLARTLTGSRMASQESSLLASLIGDSTYSALVATVPRFLSLAEEPPKNAMALLTPVILGVLGSQRAYDLDANNLARLLRHQREQIADAMPSGLADALQDSGIGLMVSPEGRTTDKSPRADAQPSMGTMSDYASASWPYWALGVLLLGGLLWSLPPSAQQPAEAEISEAVPMPLRRAYLAKAAHTWVSIGTFPNGYVGHDLYKENWHDQ